MIMVPNELDKACFETLLAHVEANRTSFELGFKSKNIETSNLLTACYKLDTNSRPLNYKLADMELLFTNYDPKVYIYT